MAKNYNKGRTIGMNPSQPKNVNLNPDDLTDVVCEKCGCQVFEPAFLFKKLSAVLSPNGKDSLIPLNIFKCSDCGHINKEFIPNNKDGSKVL